jgi:FtsP/CotA-like multicopper oxidase with cupredoxin domain
MELSRREALRLGLIGAGVWAFPLRGSGAALAALPCPEDASCSAHHPRDPAGPYVPSRLSPQIPRFQRPFQHLEERRGQDLGDRLDGYRIETRPATVEIIPGKSTPVWTYDGLLPGPCIRQKKGRASVVRFVNLLQDSSGHGIDTSIHLHGVASLPQYDGYAEDLIPFQHYKDYYYPNDKAASFWYHDHAIGRTSRNVYMGLAGMYLVDYDACDFVDPSQAERLPSGDEEIPMVIQDRRLDGDGQLLFNDNLQRSLYGDVMLVNGVPWPRLQVQDRKYRFRILNGGTSRVLNLGAQADIDGRPMPLPLVVVASDSGLLPSPMPTRRLRMGVAERYEVVIDFSGLAGREVFLINPIQAVNQDTDLRTTALLCFDVVRGPADTTPLPQTLGRLTPIEQLRSEVRSPVRVFRLDRLGSQWVINNRGWDPNHVEAYVEPCATEIWRFVNPGGGWVHPLHIHLGHFRLLSRNGLPPPAHESGMKDTFFVGDFNTLDVIGRFGPHEGRYMFHCHNLVHEDHDMMSQFQVGQGGCNPCGAPAKALPEPPTFDEVVGVPDKECSAEGEPGCASDSQALPI